MGRFPVSSEKEVQLLERMRRLGVREEDVVEQFARSSGAGGQNVNKVSTCVLLHHPPTDTHVKCQTSRSQGLNRYLARRILLDKIEERLLGVVSAERQRVEKIRRQKRRRSRRAKEKMLHTKHLHSSKKSLRSSVSPSGDQ